MAIMRMILPSGGIFITYGKLWELKFKPTSRQGGRRQGPRVRLAWWHVRLLWDSLQGDHHNFIEDKKPFSTGSRHVERGRSQESNRLVMTSHLSFFVFFFVCVIGEGGYIYLFTVYRLIYVWYVFSNFLICIFQGIVTHGVLSGSALQVNNIPLVWKYFGIFLSPREWPIQRDWSYWWWQIQFHRFSHFVIYGNTIFLIIGISISRNQDGRLEKCDKLRVIDVTPTFAEALRFPFIT